jgi:hypothetical protein
VKRQLQLNNFEQLGADARDRFDDTSSAERHHDDCCAGCDQVNAYDQSQRPAGGAGLQSWTVSDHDRALAKVGHHWLGLDDDNSGTPGSESCGELLGELFGGVGMHCSASESG